MIVHPLALDGRGSVLQHRCAGVEPKEILNRIVTVVLLAALLPQAAHAARPARVAALSLPARPLTLALDATRTVLLVGTRKSAAHGELYAVGFGDDLRTPEVLWSLDLRARVHAIAVDGDRAYLATSHNRAELVVVDLVTGAKLGSFDARGRPTRSRWRLCQPGCGSDGS
jgi:hypothetical protein